MSPSVTDKQLNQALTLARHKLRIRWTIIAVLFLLAAGSLLFAANGMFSYFSQTDSYNKTMMDLWHPSVDWASEHQQQAPQPLQVGTTYVFARGNARYDLVAEITNPNARWAVRHLAYQFMKGESVLGQGETVMLPNEQRLLTALNLSSSEIIDTIDSVRLTDVQWQRTAMDTSQFWLLPADPQFQARAVSNEGGKSVTVLPQVSWDAENNSGQNWHAVVWQVILRTSGQVVNVSEYTAHDILYGELRHYILSLSSDISRPDQIEVVPITDIFSADNAYIPDATVPLLPDRPTSR